MTEEQIQTFVDLVEWAEMLDAEHPVDRAQRIERRIDEDLPYLLVFRGEADEFIPYRPASLNVEETLPI